MKISYNKLKEYISLEETPEEVEKLLTGCGLEVESIEVFETIKGSLKGVVVGEVITCEQHPNADRLRKTTVNVGGAELLSIVCGAPNVAAGQKVLVATIGTTLYTSAGEALKIEKSKIRGEVSEGMICAEDELGLGVSHAGIIVLPEDTTIGTPAAELYDIKTDAIFEIGLTANRGDAASHIGVARDLSALLNRALTPQTYTENKLEIDPFKVIVEQELDCPRYAGVLIENISVKESPTWLKNFLKSIGLNPINNVVDATNYILHILGQPIHAFDADKIKDKTIVVKTAIAGTKFTTLDKIERTFTGIELLICDSEKPLAIGGVLGGLDSGVSEDTKNIFIESAYFNAASVRKTAKTHGISTDASFRFERGTDPEGVVDALNKTVALVQEIAGGNIASRTYDLYPTKVPATSLNFSLTKMSSLIGQHIPTEEVKAILTNLGISIKEENGDLLSLEIPARKSDVTRQADVTEEVLRIYGLNQINFPDQMLSSQSMSIENVYHQFKNKISDLLSSNGYYEMMTNSLTSSSKIENKDEVVTLLNPLSSELDSMRQSMLHSSLQAMSYNKNRQIHNVLLYEFGKTYFKTGESKYKEFQKLSIIMGGNRENENFEGKSREAGFYFMKSTLEKILELAGLGHAELVQKSHSNIDENCVFVANNKEIAHFGFVNNQLLKQYDISGKALFAEIDWNALCKSFVKQKQTYVPVPKFPSVKRDLALLVGDEVNFKQIADLIKQTERKLLQEVTIFDVYKGKNIEEGKKSYAISLKLFDPEKTLTDDIVEKSINKILQRLEKELEVKIR